MNSPFHHLDLADVRPGMVLSDMLLDRQGQVLLPKGATLTAKIIDLLPRHGIDRLPIVRSAGEVAAPAPLDEAAVTAQLAKLFRRIDPALESSSAALTLQAYMADYRLEREIAP
jgi:hypothetical protein